MPFDLLGFAIRLRTMPYISPWRPVVTVERTGQDRATVVLGIIHRDVLWSAAIGGVDEEWCDNHFTISRDDLEVGSSPWTLPMHADKTAVDLLCNRVRMLLRDDLLTIASRG